MSQGNPLSKPKKKQEFFTNLPSEIIVDILSRLPVRTIISCKCVCKPWLNLLETDEFAKSHLSKSVPGLAVNGNRSCKIIEFEDVLDLQHHELHYIPVTEYDSTYYGLIRGLVNGLLFHYHRIKYSQPDGLYILNPITREYIELHCPHGFVYSHPQVVIYGCGASKITNQHKEHKHQFIPKSECRVYTLGISSLQTAGVSAPPGSIHSETK